MRHIAREGAIRNVSRRAFMLGFGAGSLVLAVGLPRPLRAQDDPQYGGEAMPHGIRDDPILFVAIGEDGTVTIVCHRAEMGQGVRTSLPLVVADELEADWARVRVRQAPGDEPRYGNQNTDGSRSMRHHFEPMRRIGAAARMMLERAAAAHWEVDFSAVHARNHEVVHEASGRRLGYGELAKAASLMFVPPKDAARAPDPVSYPYFDKPTEWLEDGETLRLKDPEEFRYIGRDDVPLVDNFDITTGRASYAIDAVAEDMLYAVIARPPVYGGSLASFDDSAARQVPGVVDVVTIAPVPIPTDYQPLGGVAVIATDTWAAIKGRGLLELHWNDGPNAAYSSAPYRATLEAAARQPGKLVRKSGDLEAAMARAAQRVSAEYYIPHQAQAPMEPPVALAQVTRDRCTVWAGVQDPQGARERLAKRLHLPIENVDIGCTLLGGGFGRKSKSDFIVEAALLSQAMDGRPVKVLWTREDDLVNGLPNTVAVERLEAGLDAEGRPIAWLHRSVAPTISSLFAPDPKHLVQFELGMGFADTPFAVENLRLENPAAAAHTRIGWFRSVFNVPHAFAIQSFVGELAAAAGRDPKDYLLELIGPPRLIDPRAIGETWNYGEDPERYPIDTGRLRRVTEVVAEAAGWPAPRQVGRGLGIAAHRSFATYTAVVVAAEVSEAGAVSVPRVDIAVDCGPQVNPERIRAQMEGAVIQGLSLALMTGLSFDAGRAQQRNFDSYQLLRMNASPQTINVHLLPEPDFTQPLGGVGEPGLPPVAPALCNAIHAATGRRIRSLPVGDQLAAPRAEPAQAPI